MTAIAVIASCIALVIVAGAIRGKPGRGIADTALLVILFSLIAIVDFVLGRFFDTGDAAIWAAIALSAGFALDAIYGLMAPERQRLRDQKLRRLLKRRV